jgi:integrase
MAAGRKEITKRSVEALKPGDTITDTKIEGFRARCFPSGVISYELRYRLPGGPQKFKSIGRHGENGFTVDEARSEAEKLRGDVARGRDPKAERERAHKRATRTVNTVLDDYLKRDVRQRGLRSGDEIERTFKRLVRPAIGECSIYDIKKSDVVDLLDHIGEDNGKSMARHVYTYLGMAFSWYAGRGDDDFKSPMDRGMTKSLRTKPDSGRALTDEELRDLFTALDRLAELNPESPWPGFVRTLLFTSMRVNTVAKAHRKEIEGDGWIIPGDRTKHGLKHLVPMTPMLQKLFGNRPGFLFSTTDGAKPVSGFSKFKTRLDAEIAAIRKADSRPDMADWTWHDLRRTARTLMSRGGVESDHAERVLGHVIGGVRGKYDYHAFAKEKRQAMEVLAGQIKGALNPRPHGGKVVRLRKAS